ncbi:MAG: hypothetical protein QOH25_2948 [Acidobacteriota bacterium]|jgi:hypothetical protein|nr:hypothetical protein [Acidobacteriota bacterium]
MKRCPTCQRTYPDDAPNFCVSDGAQLFMEETQSYDPQKTMLASAPPPPPQYANPQPPAPNQPPQAGWPPPPPQQQGQNWGGGYYQQQPGQPPGYAPQYSVAPAAGGKGLSLTSFILGLISFAAVALIFMMAQRLIDADRDVAQACYWGSAATGVIAIVLGALALISRRQRNKWMAILGLVLGIPGILFFVYVAVTYGF